jgi:predicted ribosome quality control (RQC) complex YloA/Tae2 family protein
MSLNWVEIDKIIEEIQLENSFIQKIRQPDFGTLIFDIYRPGDRQRLLISLKQGMTRLHFTDYRFPSEIKLQRFAQLLRSRINGGSIKSIEQINRERIVRIKIEKCGEVTQLYLRLWSNSANIIACDSENHILDAFYRRPGKEEVSGTVYKPEALIKSNSNERVFNLREHNSEELFYKQIDEIYSKAEIEKNLQFLRNRAVKSTEKNLSKAESALASNLKKKDEFSDPEIFQHKGDLISSNRHIFKKGEKSITVTDWNTNEEITIEIDPKLTADENAKFFYSKASKAKSGREKVAENIRNAQQQINRLEELLLEIEESEDPDFLKKIIDSEKSISKVTSNKEEMPGLIFQSGDFRILVGRNAKENDKLLRFFTRGNDLWFHTRDFPGGYVFIKTIKGKSVPLETILDAGNLALHYSKAKANGEADLYYTHVKYLRRAKNGKTGLVLPTQEKNLHIIYDEDRIRRLNQ